MKQSKQMSCNRAIRRAFLFFVLLFLKTKLVLANINELKAEAGSSDLLQWMLQIRQHLHRYPELSSAEFKTAEFIAKHLSDLQIKHYRVGNSTGISAVIGSGPPVVALRADMDALPIQEDPDLKPQSEVPGVMHACGHDGHMTMLLGAARLLQSRAEKLLTEASVVLLFQPAEELGGGARTMIAGGALRGARAVFGLHVMPSIPAGVVGIRSGVMMAASTSFTARVVGVGGHGALPHLSVDPVIAAAAGVMGLQSLVSREVAPGDSAVVTISRFTTGQGALNIIPASVEIGGTLRALKEDTFERLRARVDGFLKDAVAAHRCTLEDIQWRGVPYPPTVNDPTLSALVGRMAAQVLGPSSVNWLEEPIMAAEDFSFYGREVPTAFAFLGIADTAKGTDAALHNPRFKMNDDVLPDGAALLAGLALQYIAEAKMDSSFGVMISATGHVSTVDGAVVQEREEL